mmetsp:Transcript_4489/g.9747  ORF Transcript_4489/g.9747 Transcript_4489/m.9747 type:complete len:321 (-) Transcript_4489:1568-2530(-)
MTMERIAIKSSGIRGDSGVGEASRVGHSPSRLHHETKKGEPFASRTTGDTKNSSVAFGSPSHRQRTPSAFVFLSDRKSVPTELKNLQERTIKRRRDFVARMHEMDCHTAKLMSKYAEERMDLDLATCDTFERTVVHPLLSSVERLSLDREASMNRSLGIPTLERRVGALDAQMTHHINVTMSDAKMDKLDSIHDNLQRNIQPEIRIENNKSNKIEGGIVQRFESVVGTINRNFLSEGASRRAEIEFLQTKTETGIPNRTERAEVTLSKIAQLRAQVSEERAKRIAADKAIYEDIVRRTAAMKRAMIAMASDGDSTTASCG